MMFAPQNSKLGIYIHWPYCARLCPYCDFNIYRARNQDFDGLLNAIIAEIGFWAKKIETNTLSSIFFGGGTPSLMKPEYVSKILEFCQKSLGFAPNIEISLEANPNDWERFADFKAAGINRLSLGVQSFDDNNLKFLGRFHDVALAQKACETARGVFDNFSLDMIHALPNQSENDLQNELSHALSFSPDHISPYQLTIEENTAFERKRRRGQIIEPKDEIAANLYDLTDNFLGLHGFEKYEISNHARAPKFQSIHNLLYWQSQNWLGIGPGSHGRLWQNGRRALLNIANPNEYMASINSKGHAIEIDETLSDLAAFEEYLIMGLRIKNGIDLNIAAPFINTNAIDELKELNLIDINGDAMFLTKAGQKLSNSIIAKLL